MTPSLKSRITGVPREIKEDEGRVGMSPAGVHSLVERGLRVIVERGAGLGSGIDDEEFVAAGAELVDGAEEVFARADLIVKVKEPLPAEYPLLRAGQVVFTFFHFAADRQLLDAIIASGATAVAYETIEGPGRRLPLLTPMSEVAGRMAVLEGSKHLEKPSGGRGLLISGVPGVEPARVVILGGGVVGLNAAKIAAGLGAQVTIFDINLERLRYLSDVLPPNVTPVYSTPYAIREKLALADLVIGAVLVPGDKAPVLVRREDLVTMYDGAVIVDVAVDQGGCVETCRPTTHSRPTYHEEGVLHYCVANMPGAVGRTSTSALTHATHPYIAALASRGLDGLRRLGKSALRGLNVHRGAVYHEGVASAFDLPLRETSELQV